MSIRFEILLIVFLKCMDVRTMNDSFPYFTKKRKDELI
jgi:hypothetical protein